MNKKSKEILVIILNWCNNHRVVSGILGLFLIMVLLTACNNNSNSESSNSELESIVNTNNIDSGELSEDFRAEGTDYINQMIQIKKATPDDITSENASETLERVEYKYDNLGIIFYSTETSNSSEKEIVEMADKSDDFQLDAFEDLEKAVETGDQKYANSAKENLNKSEQITQAIESVITQ